MQLLFFLSLVAASLAAPQFFIVPPESSVSGQENGEQVNRTLIPISLFSASSNVGVPLLGQPLPTPKETILPVQSLVKPKPVKPPLETPTLSRKNGDKAEKQPLSFDEILNAMFIKKPVEPLKPIAVDLLKHKPSFSTLRSKTGVSLDSISQNFEGQEFGMFVKLPSKETEKLPKKPTQLEKQKNFPKLRKTLIKSNENDTTNNLQDSQNIIISHSDHKDLTPTTTILPSIINTSELSSRNDSISQSTKEVTEAVEHVSESTTAKADLITLTNEVPVQTTTGFEKDKLQTPQNNTAVLLNKFVDETITVLPFQNSNLSQNSEPDLKTENIIESDLTTILLQETTTESLKLREIDDEISAAATTEFQNLRDLIIETSSINDNIDDSMATTSHPDNLPLEELTTHLSSLLEETFTETETENLQAPQSDTTELDLKTLEKLSVNEAITTLSSLSSDLSQNSELDLTTENFIETDLTTLLQETNTESSKLQEKGETASATTQFPSIRNLITELQNNNNNNMDDDIATTSQLPDEFPPEELTTHLPASEISRGLHDPLIVKEVLEQELLNEIFKTTLVSQENLNSPTTTNFVEESTNPPEEFTIKPLEVQENVTHEPLSEQHLDNDFEVESVTTDLPVQNTEASTLLEESFTFEQVFPELLQEQETQTRSSSDSTAHEVTEREFVTLPEEKITDSPITEMSLNQEISTEIISTEFPVQDESIANLTDAELLALLENKEIFDSHFTKELLDQVIQEEGIVTELPLQGEIIDVTSKNDLVLLDEGATSESSITDLLLNEEIQTEKIITELPIQNKITLDLITTLEDHETLEQMNQTESIIDDSLAAEKVAKNLGSNTVSTLIVETNATEDSELLLKKEPTTENFHKETTLNQVDLTTEISTEDTSFSEKVEIDSTTAEEINGIEVTTNFQIEDKIDNEFHINSDAEQVEVTTVKQLLIDENHFQSTGEEPSLSEHPVKEEDQVSTEKPLGKSLLSDSNSNNEHTEVTTIFPTVETTIANIDSEVPIVEEINSDDTEGDKIFTTVKSEVITEESKLELATESLSLETTTEKQSEFTDNVTVPEAEEALFVKTSTEKVPVFPAVENLKESVTETSTLVEESTDISDTAVNTVTDSITTDVVLLVENRDTEDESVIIENATEKNLDDKTIIQHSTDDKKTVTKSDFSNFSSTEEPSTPTDSVAVSQNEEIPPVRTSTEEAPASTSTEVLIELVTETGDTVEETKETTQISGSKTFSTTSAEALLKNRDEIEEILITENTTENSIDDETVFLPSSANKQTIDESDLLVSDITTELPFENISDNTILTNEVPESKILSLDLITSELSTSQDEVSLTTTEIPLETSNDHIMQEQSSNKVTEIKLPVQHDELTADRSSTAVEIPHEAENKVQDVFDHPSKKVTENESSVQHTDASIPDLSNIPTVVDPVANKLPDEPLASDSSISSKAILSANSKNLISETKKSEAKDARNEILLEKVSSAPSIHENITQTIDGSTVDKIDTSANEINNKLTSSTSSILSNVITAETKSSGSGLLVDTNNTNLNRLLTDEEIASLLTPETKPLNTQTISSQNLGKTLTVNSKLHRDLLRTNLAAKHFGIKTLAKVLKSKQIPINYNGAFVDPKTLVAPQFRDFIYENEAPEVIAAKIAFFRVQDGLAPVHNQP